MTEPRPSMAVSVAPSLFADALVSVLAADEVDDVVDLTQMGDVEAHTVGRHYDTAVISPGVDRPDADVVIVLPPSGRGEVAITRAGRNEEVVVDTVADLFDLLDSLCPADRPRRRPLS